MLTSDKLDYLIEINKELAQRIRKLEQSEYQAYVRRFENSRTYYIHVDRALEYLERKLI